MTSGTDDLLAELVELMRPIAEYHQRSNDEPDEDFFWSTAPEFMGASWDELTTIRKGVSYVEKIACGKRIADILTENTDVLREGVNTEHDAPMWESLDVDGEPMSYCPEMGLYAPKGFLIEQSASILCANSGSAGNKGPFVSITVPRIYRTEATEWLDSFVEKAIGQFNVLKGRVLSATATKTGMDLSIITDAKVSPRSALIMDDAVWDELELNASVLTERNEDLKALGMSTRRGVLLEGKPGVGKSQLCRTFAEELNQQGCTVVHVSYSVGSHQLKSVFDSAEHLGKVVFILDDIDLYLRKRNDGDPGALSDFLSVMDGAAKYDDILVLGTTNDVSVLDDAAIRSARFDRVIKVSNPTFDNGARILDSLFAKIGIDNIDTKKVIAAAPKDPKEEDRMAVSGANLQEVVRRAVMTYGVAEVSTERLVEVMVDTPWVPDSIIHSRNKSTIGFSMGAGK